MSFSPFPKTFKIIKYLLQPMEKESPKKRIVLKKGKIVVTRQPEFVIALAKKIYKLLKPHSKRIEIVGSIRRKKPDPFDIDIVLIPKDKEKIEKALEKKGTHLSGGEHRTAYKIEGIQVEIYFAQSQSWGAMMLTYTGSSGNNIGLRVIAKKQGLLLNQYGLFKHRVYIAGKTETSIYKALDRPLTKPEDRD
jgi:DNA polymerase (family X)